VNTPAELAVELKNQHPDGGAEPRVEWGAGGVEGAGVYRLAYGVRVQGTFLLSIKLMGQVSYPYPYPYPYPKPQSQP